MLRREFRIPRGIRFNNSRLTANPLFTLKVNENGLSFNRFAIIVSKKVDKRAVIRNRIRRLISSCLEEVYNKLQQGKDTIFIVKRGAINKSRQDFFKEIESVLEKE
jgi:ribonuclease P protein component